MRKIRVFFFPAFMSFFFAQHALAQDCSAQQSSWEQAVAETKAADAAVNAWNANYNRMTDIIYYNHYMNSQGCMGNYLCLLEITEERDRALGDLEYEGFVLQQNFDDKFVAEWNASWALTSCQAGLGI